MAKPTWFPSASQSAPESGTQTPNDDMYASLTMWPAEDENYPFALHELLALPKDDERFEGDSIQQLMISSGIQLGRAFQTHSRAMRGFSHIHTREKELAAENEKLKAELASMKSQLENEKSQHDDTMRHADEIMIERDILKNENFNLNEQKAQILAELDDLKFDHDVLKKNFINLEDDFKDIELKMVNLVEASDQLHADYGRIMIEGHLTEYLEQKVISEFKKSPELTAHIVRQFGDGYLEAKTRIADRIRKAGQDPGIVESEDEVEDEDEDEDEDGETIKPHPQVNFLCLRRCKFNI